MYQIIWSDRAEQKYHDELLYWLNRNKSEEYPLKIINEIDRIENLLLNNPYLGRIADTENIRVFPVLRKFLLYYEIIDNIIYIVAFINGSRNKRL